MSLFRFPERRSTLENPQFPLTSAALVDFTAGPSSDSGVRVTPEKSLQMSAVWRAVTLLSGVLGSTPLGIYGLGTFVRQQSVLLDDPHPDMTPFELWRWSYVSRLLWGNSYMQKVRDGAGRLNYLYPIPAARVKVGRVAMTAANPAGKIFQVTNDAGHPVPMTSYEIFHIPGFGYDGVCGVSPIRMATQAIGLGMAAEEYGARFFGNGSLMSGVLQTEQRLDQPQADALKNRWQAKVGGLRNSHEVAILDAGAKFQSMTIPNVDAQFLESRIFQIGEIERFFGVPPFLLMDTEKSTSWGCLPGDTLVFTTGGPKPIIDVKPGDEVWSYSDGGMEPAKVTDWVMTGYKPLLTVKTTTRELRLTSNHRVPIRRYFGGLGRGKCEWRTIEVSAGEIVPGDYVLVPHGFKGGDRTVAPNGRELTVKAMELCGLYLGDGSADKNRVEIAHAVDDPHMPYYRASIRAEFGVEPYTDKGRGTRTRFSSVAARSLLECGFTGNAHTKRVPEWVFRLTPELQLGFLRGYLDADGCIGGKTGAISFASCNKLMLEDVRHLCIQLGVPVGRVVLGRKAGPGVIRGKSYQATAKYVLNLSSVSFNRKIGSNHPLKVVNLVDVPTERRLRYDQGWVGELGARKTGPGTGWDHPDVVLQKVVSVDRGTVKVPVYDITVADLHHFVADGVVVHNTGLEQQTLGWVKFDLIPNWFTPTEQRVTKELTVAGAYAKYELQALLRGDSEARGSFYTSLFNTGVLSANEIRALEELPPVPGLDEHLQLLTMGPYGVKPSTPAPTATPDPGGTDASSTAND